MTDKEVRLAYKMANRMARIYAPAWMDFKDVRQEYAIAGWKAFQKLGYFHVGYVRKAMWNRFLNLLETRHLPTVSIFDATEEEDEMVYIVEPAYHDVYLPIPKGSEMHTLIMTLATFPTQTEARETLGICKKTWEKKMAAVKTYIEENML